ncbi:MAG: hypothetical protein WCI05_17535, partial [Myxococcales bacterium]
MVFPVRNAVLCFGLALFFAGRSTSAQSGAVEDSCSDVLRFGLHGIYSSMREPTLEAAMKWWACGADERSVVQALNTTATGALTDFPVGAWIERSVLRGWRTQKCPSGTGLFASRDFEQVAYRVLSSYPGDTIPAWTSCRTARRNPRLSSRIVTYPDALGHYGLMVHIAASPRPAPSPETGNPISFFDTTLASPARPILGQVRPLPPPPSPGCRYVHPGFASAGGMMQFFFCERPSPARVELKMTTSFGQLLPAPTLPALPTGPTCPSPGGEYHTDTASDPVNCGTCGLSCG